MLSLLLLHDLLLARGGIALPQSHGLRASIERHKGRLTSEFTLARLRRKAPSVQALKEQIQKASAGEEARYPRWVRVNALLSSLEEQLETTFSQYARATTLREVVDSSEKRIYIDPHVPNLVAVTQGTDLTKTPAYSAGKIILQDKASCFPAYLLDPRCEDGDVVDACAAPGNKTTHLAAILHEHQPEFQGAKQTIYAFEKDSRRAQTLEKMVKIAGSKDVTRIAFGQDFLQADPKSERFGLVGALLLDPSCSGSGIVGRDSMPTLHLPEAIESKNKGSSKSQPAKNRKRKHGEVEDSSQHVVVDDDGNETVMKSEKDLEARLTALSDFQLSIVLHAFQFPSATKITYSTCSIHSQENEEVVMRALESSVAQERGWQILKRQDQVSGMRDWPVRGLPEACRGDQSIADGCIRSYKNDGRGVMGFFVAAFVRPRSSEAEPRDAASEPYLRDEDDMIIRDVTGMPVLKSTGASVSLGPTDENEADGEQDDDDGEEEEEEEDESSTSGSTPRSHNKESWDDEDEWTGLGN